MKNELGKPSTVDYYALSFGAESALDFSDLTTDRALTFIPEPAKHNFKAVYQWFMENTGKKGPREYGKRLPGVDADFAHVAQRGIHVPGARFLPKNRKYALTVTSSGSDFYSNDRPLIQLGDGTWVLVYSAHMSSSSHDTDSIWNNALMNNLRDGVPVGVFVRQGRGNEYFRALAYVEDYNPQRNVFILHGPVLNSNKGVFASKLRRIALSGEDGVKLTPEELERDQRDYAYVNRVVRKGQQSFRQELVSAYEGTCAITGCKVEDTLQAAHIIDYRGTNTNVVSNGLLLRADVHILFDRSLLAVNPSDMEVEISDRLSSSRYAALKGEKIARPRDPSKRPDPNYLSVKYELFKQMDLAS